jgi:hypothetical protein
MHGSSPRRRRTPSPSNPKRTVLRTCVCAFHRSHRPLVQLRREDRSSREPPADPRKSSPNVNRWAIASREVFRGSTGSSVARKAHSSASNSTTRNSQLMPRWPTRARACWAPLACGSLRARPLRGRARSPRRRGLPRPPSGLGLVPLRSGVSGPLAVRCRSARCVRRRGRRVAPRAIERRVIACRLAAPPAFTGKRDPALRGQPGPGLVVSSRPARALATARSRSRSTFRSRPCQDRYEHYTRPSRRLSRSPALVGSSRVREGFPRLYPPSAARSCSALPGAPFGRREQDLGSPHARRTSTLALYARRAPRIKPILRRS